MLPSTGYFKAINCPFYENGYCERPYCHFRHSRRDGTISGTSSSSAITSESSQVASKPQNTSTPTIAATNSDVIEQLVSEAVKKVLVDQNVSDTEKIVNKVVEGLKPKLVPVVLSTPSVSQKIVDPDPPVVGKHIGVPVIPTVKTNPCVYNPTPISELKRRHIPITAYEPTRESKVVKRKSSIDKPWMAVIRNVPIAKESKVSYTPTAINQTSTERNSTHKYVPTVKSESSFNLYDVSSSSNDSYIPEKRKKKELYCPKPKKRREEYVPRKPKIPLKDKQHLEDDSFDVLDEILCSSESNPTIAIDDDSEDVIEVDSTVSDDDDVIAIEVTAKEEKLESKVINHVSHDEKENKELSKTNDINNENNLNSSTQVNNEKHNNDLSLTGNKDDETNSKPKYPEKSDKEDSSNKHKEQNDVKSNKNKDENLMHTKKKEDDSKHTKYKDEDSKYIKNKDKERSEEKKDREKDREKDKEKSREKDKHSSKNSKSDRDHISSSSKDNKNKDKDKDKDKVKDSRGSSHRSKKDSKSDKERSSKSKDSRDKKESKDRSRHKSDDKSRHKSKSSSSDSKNKSSKHSSHSSHKSSKLEEKPLERDDISNKHEERSDQEGKCDSPEYEEFSPFYDEQLLEDSDSDHDVEEECRKIFQEYEVPDHPKDVMTKTPFKPEVEESEELHRKRVAHASATSGLSKSVGPAQPPKRMPNPQQRMYERWRLMKEVAAEKAAEKAVSDHQINGNGKIRIAQVPYAMSLALEKKKVLEQAAKVEAKTVAQNRKGSARIAHIPQVVPQLIRPEPLQPTGTHKFPLNVRQFYVNAMQDICIQIYINSEDAAQRAVREEFTCYEKCKALNVYKNSCMLTVHRLRKEVDQKSDELSTSTSGMVSHEAVLVGKVKGTWSVIKPKKSVTDFKGVSLYNLLTKWILTEQELKDNGYPRPHPEGPKGRAKLYVTNVRGKSTLSKVPNERYCCRCNKSYMVDKQGFSVRKENCIYHYARKFTFRGESKYICCKQDASSDGCCDAATHVWDYVDVENLRGYVSTFDKDDASSDVPGIFALDCEMCYTTQGLELTRVTVINEDIQVVYETLVKPTHPIIDYNTRFSGINESDMANVTTTLLDVQATLLSMFSSKTILIGHSLESDFKALKLLHNTVIDTSVMFPHKNGPPYKRALKNLCSEYLRKFIQENVGGHDSKEDAAACMELVLWKVKEEAKLQ